MDINPLPDTWFSEISYHFVGYFFFLSFFVGYFFMFLIFCSCAETFVFDLVLVVYVYFCLLLHLGNPCHSYCQAASSLHFTIGVVGYQVLGRPISH